jgi:hypothetical protein
MTLSKEAKLDYLMAGDLLVTERTIWYYYPDSRFYMAEGKIPAGICLPILKFRGAQNPVEVLYNNEIVAIYLTEGYDGGRFITCSLVDLEY